MALVAVSAGMTAGLAEAALAMRLRAISRAELDRKNRAPRIEDVALDSIPGGALLAALDDVRGGDGGELKQPSDDTLFPRFHSSRSSCALAVNAFAPWRLDPATLEIGSVKGYTALRFERKLPINGVSGRTPPNLDVVAEGSQTLVIESKLIEHIGSSKKAEFASVYNEAVATLAHPPWQAEFASLKEEPRRYGCFDAAQIVKHYLGLKSNYARQTVSLLYLFWEPTDHPEYPVFAKHRDEVEAFAGRVEDPDVSFSWLTYGQLWEEWDGLSTPAWLPDHVELLRSRYSLPLKSA